MKRFKSALLTCAVGASLAVGVVAVDVAQAPPAEASVTRVYATAYHHARDQCRYLYGGNLTTIHGYRDWSGRLYWNCDH